LPEGDKKISVAEITDREPSLHRNENPLAIMAASAVSANGQMLRSGGYGLVLTNWRITTTTPLGPHFSLALEEIATVSELQRGRFTLNTAEGDTWSFVESAGTYSGMRSRGVDLTNDGNGTRFFLALHRALGFSASLAVWAETRPVPGQTTNETRLLHTHAVPLIDHVAASVALCGKKIVSGVSGTFDAGVARLCNRCARFVQLDRISESPNVWWSQPDP
jgi:hypothetical protein